MSLQRDDPSELQSKPLKAAILMKTIFVICKSRQLFSSKIDFSVFLNKTNTGDHKFGQLSSIGVSPDDSLNFGEKIQIEVFRLNV